jgi:drug/metabolite transporter superfamily protein YnfA
VKCIRDWYVARCDVSDWVRVLERRPQFGLGAGALICLGGMAVIMYGPRGE